MGRINQLFTKMIGYYQGDPKQIQHFAKVYSFAKLIGEEEHLEEHTRYILEAAALVHDIGIRPAMEKYGSAEGKYQEELGPAEAEKMLREVAFHDDVVQRVTWLVGHHHTYGNIEGKDYQILVEADFLVNFFEEGTKKEEIRQTIRNIFRTDTGKRIAMEMFVPEDIRLSETWAQDGLQDLEDFIEEQGIYIRQ